MSRLLILLALFSFTVGCGAAPTTSTEDASQTMEDEYNEANEEGAEAAAAAEGSGDKGGSESK